MAWTLIENKIFWLVASTDCEINWGALLKQLQK